MLGTASRGASAGAGEALAEPIARTDALDRHMTASPPADPGDGVVELHASLGPLRAQLATQATAAKRSGETLLVETTAQRCVPCAEVAAAAADGQVQQALTRVRFLRVDVGEFRDELKALRMNEPAVPWFYLIDVRGKPSDAISADECDENEAANIAPVLGAFVKGTLRSRRQSWRGETAL
jgi:thiol:disulfide interchange protein